ncbi:MAG: helix-turn-helix domain-containing protein [Ktedonobacteraceae bacterium]
MVTQGNNEFLTPDEACQVLGVTRRTLDRYADKKRTTPPRIKKYQRGIRNVVFKRVDVEQLARELTEVRDDD